MTHSALDNSFDGIGDFRNPPSAVPHTLAALLKGIAGGKLPEVSVGRLITDSRRVGRGDLFFAIKGHKTDGNFYLEEAIDRGAAAVISEREPGPRASRVPWVTVESPRDVLAAVAARFYGHPDRELDLVGVTGTNGKTTVTFLVQHILERLGRKTGLIGTVRYDLGGRTLPSFRTTPESVDTFSMLHQMRRQGCKACAMEVSSHGIEQRRVQAMAFRVAAFLNLTQDHIDYHGSMEDYFAVKARLLNGGIGPLPGVAVGNEASPWGQRLLKELPSDLLKLSFGGSRSDFRAESVELEPAGTRFELHWPGGRRQVETPLLGAFNVSNCLAALAIIGALGLDVAAASAVLSGFSGVPGRMERVDDGLPFKVLVDYAHTDDAMENALTMLRPVTPGRLLVVFGCGGERDRVKRPRMTRAVLRFGDLAWITSDNPRNESLEQIFADMREGVASGLEDRVLCIVDRRRAISEALDHAEPGDTVLIAGKGHETYQEIGGSILPFDDRQVVRELIRKKGLLRDNLRKEEE